MDLMHNVLMSNVFSIREFETTNQNYWWLNFIPVTKVHPLSFRRVSTSSVSCPSSSKPLLRSSSDRQRDDCRLTMMRSRRPDECRRSSSSAPRCRRQRFRRRLRQEHRNRGRPSITCVYAVFLMQNSNAVPSICCGCSCQFAICAPMSLPCASSSAFLAAPPLARVR